MQGLAHGGRVRDNRILAALSAIRREQTVVRSRIVTLPLGGVLGRPGVPLDNLYFPQSALIASVVELSSGDSIDGTLVGSEGVFGAAAAFGAAVPVHLGVVQRGGTCAVMPVLSARRLVHEDEAFAGLLIGYQQFLLAQAQQNAACAARHSIRERFCTRLLQFAEPDGEIRLTQEDFARALGVQRTSVSLVAGGLQAEGIIRAGRGHIGIRDRGKLLAAACECYGTVEAYKRVLLCEAVDPVAGSAAP